jgi:hypothetical protein
MYRIDRLFGNISEFFYKIKRSISYARKSWDIYDYDYTSSLIMFEYALSRTEPLLRNGYSVNAEKTARKCQIMRNLLRRIARDEQVYDYLMEEVRQKYGENDWVFIKSERMNGFTRIANSNPKYDSDEYYKDVKRVYKKEQQLKQRDLEMFAKLFVRDIKHFWD